MHALFCRIVLVIGLLGIPMTPAAAASHERCFPETGYCISGPFREFWEQQGGLSVFGYPIGPIRTEINADDRQSYQTQWYERARFELHPENPAPYTVQLGRMGSDLLRRRGVNWANIPNESATAEGCTSFPSNQRVCNTAVVGRGIVVQTGFLDYWQAHGLADAGSSAYNRSLALLGMPISAPLIETNSSGDRVLAQYFERARVERAISISPDGSSAELGAQVLQGRLGSELQETRLTVNTLATQYLPTALPYQVLADTVGLIWQGIEDDAGVLFRADQDGQNVRRLASDLNGIKALSADQQYVYWVSGAGLRRVLRSGGEPEILASFDTMAVRGFAQDTQSLYWSQPDPNTSGGTLVMRLPLSGGAPQPLSGDIWNIIDLASDGQHLYWANDRLEVKRVPLAGGQPEFVYQTRGVARSADLAFAGNALYVAFDGTVVRDRPPADGMVMKIIKGERDSVQVLDETRARSLALSADQVYWTTATGQIRSAALAGGPAETLITGQSQPSSLAVNSPGLFWINTQPVATTDNEVINAVLYAPFTN